MALIQIDSFKELFNVGVGQAAGILNQMVGTNIKLEVPDLEIIRQKRNLENIEIINKEVLSAIEEKFEGVFSGKAILAFPLRSASRLVSLLIGEEIGSPDLNSAMIGTITEVGNILINALLGTIGNIFKAKLTLSFPHHFKGFGIDLIDIEEETPQEFVIIICKTRFSAEKLQIIGYFFLIIETQAMERLLSAMDKKME